jgi:hypothetical protein
MQTGHQTFSSDGQQLRLNLAMQSLLSGRDSDVQRESRSPSKQRLDNIGQEA